MVIGKGQLKDIEDIDVIIRDVEGLHIIRYGLDIIMGILKDIINSMRS
ncbi:MAG: hypothetical protein ABEH43_06580 [Flavobacteriales bacterium]